MRTPPAESPEVPESPEMKARDFRLLSDLIHEASGIRLGQDKRELLAARLRPLLRKIGVRTFAGLCSAVRTDRTGEKLGLLVDRATTNTTGFFRHRGHFELLRARLPALAERGRVRIWSAGCSSGEEPYTIALLLAGQARDAKVLATDVSRRALAKAKLAIYDEDALEPVPPTLRGRFERLADGRFRLDAETRSLVTLRHHDLRSRTALTRSIFDAVFCRNVLIYFDARERAEVVARLTHVLHRGGLLFLGPSESGIELPASLRRVGPAAYEKG